MYSITAGSTLRQGSRTAQLRIIFKHLRYSKSVARVPDFFDIAILYWIHPLTMGPDVGLVRLPAPNAAVPYGQNANLTGWGQTDITSPDQRASRLRVASLTLMDNDECNKLYAKQIREYMFCAGLVKGDRGACVGDDGDPLVIRGVQYGIKSWGLDCKLPRRPGVYTRIPFFVKWIHENVEKTEWNQINLFRSVKYDFVIIALNLLLNDN